jgi:hypothetical protein
MLITGPIMLWWWVRGAALGASADLADAQLRPAPYHPSQEFSTGQAVAYLATSPAAIAAAA